MTRQEALKFWEWRYENAKDYYDDHWEADERKSHREYVQALEWAVKALADRKTEPTISKMEQVETDINVGRKDEPQIDGTIDEARFKAHCMNCQRDVADIKCLDCDGDKYFIAAEPQTEREGE